MQWQPRLGFVKNTDDLAFGEAGLLHVDLSFAIVPEKYTFEWS
jgi:hypothetical protein